MKEQLELKHRENVEDTSSGNGTIEQQNRMMNALIRHMKEVMAENEETIKSWKPSM